MALAPLHNPPALAGIRATREAFPELPQVAVFDTAFFAGLPAAAATYAVDAEVAAREGIRRYGMHGTSHEYVAGEAARFLGRRHRRAGPDRAAPGQRRLGRGHPRGRPVTPRWA